MQTHDGAGVSRESERALRESKERFASFAASSSDALWIRDAKTYAFQYVSPAVESVYGVSPNAVLADRELINNLILPDQRGPISANIARIAQGETIVHEYQITRPTDGAVRWIRSTGFPLRDEDGGVGRIGAIAQDITERKLADEALRESEARFRSVFETIDEGFAIMEAMRDGDDRVVDAIYRQANRASAQQVGVELTLGSKASELFSRIDPAWTGAWQHVLDTGESVRSEEYIAELDRWYTVHFSRIGEPGSGLIAGVFNDITDRRRAEKSLSESEERQAFLLKVSDALRPLADPADIQGEITRLLREQLSAGWCYYIDWDFDKKVGLVLRDSAREGLPSLAGAHDVSDAPEFLELLAGRGVLTVRDYAGYEHLPTRILQRFTTLGFRSMMVAPLFKGDRLIASLLVGDTELRDWSPREELLLAEVAERTWAAVERGRAEAALAASETRLSAIYAQAAAGFAETETDGRFIRVNPEYCRIVGRSREELLGGLTMHAITHPDDRPANRDQFTNATPFEVRKRYIRPDGSEVWVHNSVAPIRGADGRIASLHAISTDISRAVQAEIVLRESEERQAFLLKLSDALRAEPPADAMGARAMRMLAEHLGVDRAYIADMSRREGTGRVEIEHRAADLPSLKGTYKYSDFPNSLRRLGSGPLVVSDIDSDPSATDLDRGSLNAMGLRAIVAVFLRRGEHDAVWALATGGRTARTWTPADVRLVEDVAERTWAAMERARAETAMRETEERLQQFGEASQDVLWIRDAETLRWVYLTPAFETIYGITREEALRAHDYRTWLDLIVPEDREGAAANIAKVREGEKVAFEFRIQRPSDGAIRWMRNTDFPIRDGSGRVVLIGGIGHDLTDLKQAGENQKLLTAELQHRVRNTLAVVRSITRRTAASSETVDDFAMNLGGRIDAFSRVQSAVTRDPSQGVDLAMLVAEELRAASANEGESLRVSGPDLRLRPKPAESFALGLHELVTNAIKHGALLNASARIAVTWAQKNGVIFFRWKETGLVLDGLPRREGLGTEILTRTLPYDLGAKARLQFEPDGLLYELELPETILLPPRTGPV